jgi:hypothetical protein
MNTTVTEAPQSIAAGNPVPAGTSGPDLELVARVRAAPLEQCEAEALAEQYLEGHCLVFAFAVHWLTGWKVEALGERNSPDFSHFATIGPDGLVWDAAGPRVREEVERGFATDPAWEEVDAYRFAFSDAAGVTEDDVNEACVAALRLFGDRIDPHLARTPTLPDDLVPETPSP